MALSQGYRTVLFGCGALGRIVDTAYADGQNARYFYDDLGNRRLSEYEHGGSVAYAYDAAGIIVGIETTGYDGVQRPTATLETAEPIERMAYDGSLTLSVDYGRSEYGPLGASADMTPKSTREEPIAAGRELAEPPSKDPRLAVLMADRGLGRQPDYGVVTFGERFPAADRDPLDTGVAHSRDARKLLEVASAVLGEAAADRVR